MLKRILILSLLLMPTAVVAGVVVKPGGTSYKLRQGTQELGSFSGMSGHEDCRAAARARVTNPLAAPIVTYQVRSGSGQLLATLNSEQACMDSPTERLVLEGATRTAGGNVTSCQIITKYTTAYPPPMCVATFNFLGTFYPTATPSDPDPPDEPCECPEPPPVPGGTAVLSWSPPTTTRDGQPLRNLAGYFILYGRSADKLYASVVLPNAGASGYTLRGLDAGTWFFAVRSYTTNFSEQSIPSNIVTRTVTP